MTCRGCLISNDLKKKWGMTWDTEDANLYVLQKTPFFILSLSVLFLIISRSITVIEYSFQ